ncbi:N-acyl-D-amino-acid deacylase family protein [Chromatocurvus halotolerans]|uniref:N-acyl-D-aspartate/D-glutamate deacylase n=1 Tax=Chromatocurvus halotolerans TaxID=1132028 RepID=A0A4V2SBW1_9GAMM|nr:amidohydrolase family protein [Chromatocurvus halotolerans]TCO77050.1 N-acyl-D-aspartate/D-glutamate deacylase [Chromatocurvus halotolerans]
MTTAQSWDTLIRNATVFDGSGAPPRQLDVALRRGRIAAKGSALPENNAAEIVDASGKWLMPGLLDIHTHLDLEVDLDPRLPEVVRHGTTTVLVGNCSLGTCFGRQDDNGQDPIVDCFTRVENIPKSVLRKCVDAIHWDNTGDYLDHLDALPLGPNVGVFVPHSMLRIEVMGLEDSISREPTTEELERMAMLLERAMQQGYVGMSTDGLPFHYLANAPHKDQRIPTQFASFGELKRLLKVVREHNRVWQTTPILENRVTALLYFTLTSGRLFGRTLKTSALSVMEFVLAPRASHAFLGFARLMNSRFFRGQLHFQALGTNFRVWSDGMVSPLFEELDSTCQLIAKEYDDVAGRRALLDDPAFIEAFRREWHHGRRGRNLARLKAWLGMPDHLVIRDLDRLNFDGAPVADWDGETMQQVYERVLRFQAGEQQAARSQAERDALSRFPVPLRDDADFMLHLMREYDKGFRFWADMSNIGNAATIDYLLHEHALPGFNDSGAHITNMAFFDTNLMSLKLAQQQGLETVGRMVRRLTREPAEFFGLDAGTLDIGAQADLVIIDPDVLRHWDCNDTREYVYRDLFEHHQMVNRPPGIVEHVFIRGEAVWCQGEFGDALGARPLGRALRAAH